MIQCERCGFDFCVEDTERIMHHDNYVNVCLVCHSILRVVE